ncbi:hypothetical protein ACHAW5_000315 [Stephanodiscus triporus]|uniref:Uncharacterized protein n=1 Tax=Stephanodiscus triporus TaxID=2934178 RepID=A0ABD3NF71_9STRA
MQLTSMKYIPNTRNVIDRASLTFATTCCYGNFPALARHRRRRPKHNHQKLHQFTTSSSEFDKDYTKYRGGDEGDADARSQFGTKAYWDAMYEGMGEFSADEYLVLQRLRRDKAVPPGVYIRCGRIDIDGN